MCVCVYIYICVCVFVSVRICLEKKTKRFEGKKDLRWPSYAYNLLGNSKGPQRWMANMSDSTPRAISYGSKDVSC